jgi:hypothetical protein
LLVGHAIQDPFFCLFKSWINNIKEVGWSYAEISGG